MELPSYEELAKFCKRFVIENMASEFHREKNLVPEVIFQINAKDFGEHLTRRAEWHNTRAVFWEGRIKDTQTESDAGAWKAGMTGDPFANDRESARTERDKAAEFHFMADHLIADASYALSYRDMDRYEFNKRGNG